MKNLNTYLKSAKLTKMFLKQSLIYQHNNMLFTACFLLFSQPEDMKWKTQQELPKSFLAFKIKSAVDIFSVTKSCSHRFYTEKKWKAWTRQFLHFLSPSCNGKLDQVAKKTQFILVRKKNWSEMVSWSEQPCFSVHIFELSPYTFYPFKS